jgi:hypothetical protein
VAGVVSVYPTVFACWTGGAAALVAWGLDVGVMVGLPPVLRGVVLPRFNSMYPPTPMPMTTTTATTTSAVRPERLGGAS